MLSSTLAFFALIFAFCKISSSISDAITEYFLGKIFSFASSLISSKYHFESKSQFSKEKYL